MDCIEPNAFPADRLLAYADGEPDPALAAHLPICPACANALAAYGVETRVLRACLYRADCPPTHDLGELALDLLSPARTTETRAHLAACPHCQTEFRTLRDALATDPLLDLVSRPSPLRRLIARLLPPPTEVMAYAMVRGEPSDAALTYEVEGITASLTVERERSGNGQQWILLAMILNEADADGPPIGTARLLHQGGLVEDMPLDELGNLIFAGLAPGHYDLELALSDRLIAIEHIPVGVATI